jgi:glycosyltransferase involved in cell wall biosynthesis
MHILIVHNIAIPVILYGGVERVAWWLGKELCRRGHKVTYLVPPGSSCPFAKVLVYDPQKSLNEQIPDNIDLVHLHFQTKERLKKPHLITCHGNFHRDKNFDINTVFISSNHAKRNGSECFVYNGIDIKDYGPVDFNAQRRHLLFIGYAKRPEKNLKECFYIARKTNNILAIMGRKSLWFRWRPWALYKGFVGGEEKNRIIQASKALLFPVRWHEPFGIAIIESLYFGCPVFGSTYGSLPELVHPDVGVVSLSRKVLVQAVKDLPKFNSKRCHEYVCDQFTSKHMTDNYMKLYQKVLSGQTLNPTPPINGGNFSRDDLLPFG